MESGGRNLGSGLLMADEEIHFDGVHYFWQETHHSPATADYAFKISFSFLFPAK